MAISNKAQLAFPILMLFLFSIEDLYAQSLDCFLFTYYIPSSGQFVEASSELSVGQKVRTRRRACLPGESKPRQPEFSRIDRKSVEPSIERATRAFKVNPNLVRAVIQVESGYRPAAISPKGAKGLMQLMDNTALRYDVTDPFNPDANIYAGTNHLSDLMSQFDNNVEFALAAYNAGADSVIKHNGIPPFKETQNYVEKVVTLFDALEADTPNTPTGGNQTRVSDLNVQNNSINAYGNRQVGSERNDSDVNIAAPKADILQEVEIIQERRNDAAAEPKGG